MVKNKSLYIMYFILILTVTVFLSIVILRGDIKKLPILGKVTNPIKVEINEYQLIRSLKIFQEIEDLPTQEFRNSLGFKDVEWEIEKPLNTYRIIALGDSMTEGAGINNEFTWPKQLQKRLNDHSSSTKFEVLNMGAHGRGYSAGTLDELKTLTEFGLRYNPDIVVLQYYNNDWVSPDLGMDIIEIWKKYKVGEYKLPKKLEDEIKKLNASESAISRLIAEIIIRDYLDNSNREEEWDKWVKEPMNRLIKICKEDSIELIVITWDSVWWQKVKLIPLLEEYNISFHDLSENIAPQSCPSHTRLADCHLSSFGYEIVANKTAEIVLEKIRE